MNPLVSVIIPTYNRGDKIINCLESIVAQSYPDLEIIVVDDGSEDSTQEVIEAFIKNKSLKEKLLYYRQLNKGAPVARNLGLEKAGGTFIVFFDSDDIMLPERINKQVIAIKNEDSDCCACGFVNSQSGKEFIPEIDKSKGTIGSLLYWKLMGSTQCWMYKREILLEIGGYDESFTCYQDWDLTFRYLTNCKRVALVRECLNIFVDDDRADRITSKIQLSKRISNLEQYFNKVLTWLITEGENIEIIRHILLLYVHQVILAYYKQGVRTEALKAFFSLNLILSKSLPIKRLICNVLVLKHLIVGAFKL